MVQVQRRRSAARKRWTIAGSAVVMLTVGGVASAAVAHVPDNPFGTSMLGQHDVAGRILTSDNHWISPFGARAATFSAQSIGSAISPDGSKVAVQTGGTNSGTPSITILDAASGSVLQTFGGTGVAAPVYSPDGSALYAATTASVLKYAVGSNGMITNPTAPAKLALPGGSLPYGLTLSADGAKLYLALSGSNKLGVVDTATNTLTAQVAVGNAPQAVTIAGNKAFVSNRGGRTAVAGDTTNKSDGTNIVSDPVTGASATGTVSVVDLATNTVVDTVNVGLQPTSLTQHDGAVFVTNTNSDTVSVIDAATHKVTQTVNVEPLPGIQVGSSPNSIAFTDAKHMLVSVGRDNALAQFEYDGPRRPVKYEGLIPTDWYPNQVQFDARLGKVIVSNQQGIGTDGAPQSYAYKGTLTSFAMPDGRQLADTTRQVFSNNAWDRPAQAGNLQSDANGHGRLTAIPRQHGETSPIKHVFMIIKENRTYDQILGDLGKGNGDPSRTSFGAAVTPNEHSMANTFTTFDNFYDNGMLSADGHNWLTQAEPNDYLAQDAASAWARSYPYNARDALAYQRDGFIWDAAARAGKSARNYGEYEAIASGTPGSWQQYYADSQILEGKATGSLPVAMDAYKSYSDVPSNNAISNPNFPQFNLAIPDQYKVDVWEQDFKKAEQTGDLPALTTMSLPNDHTGGPATPRAQVADNDLAVGRMISDISHSRFWKDSAVFVFEDDTQAGTDHVDGHRAPFFIASPYVKRGVVNSEYFTQVNAVKTIEQILGMQPLNQEDRAATPMFSAFTDTPNVTPYTTVANQIPLTEGVSNLIPVTPASGSPSAQASVAPAAPADQQQTADAWAQWHQNVAMPKLTGEHAQVDGVNQPQLGRYDWYTSTGWIKPFPGDNKILRPDEVPGRYLFNDDNQ
ncbi:bifunctional YncE family protein/alkaline phosphatase family protein [Amycolatopsis sp. NPDC050768]|uniref:bifunctional YncE family protein/alkaline phosphatase family protein n=1 Tax=Amycolatopsis sp. NPDC050768 TaxID=3154839 RepID=UPI0033ECA1EF